ncbi:unnamed protein product [Arabidopsis halleri]
MCCIKNGWRDNEVTTTLSLWPILSSKLSHHNMTPFTSLIDFITQNVTN